MAAERTTRVCPECGEPAGSQPFCSSCGRNLTQEPRLPTRAEWETAHPEDRPSPSAAPFAPLPQASGNGVPRLVRWGGWVVLLIAVVFGLLNGRFVILGAVPLVAGVYLIVKGRRVAGLVMAVAAVALPVLEGFWVTAYLVPSPSMEPTLNIGDHIAVDRSGIGGISTGDLVVFHPPAGADPVSPVCGDQQQGTGHGQACGQPVTRESRQTFIKRVVAGPGDTIRILDGHVYRNGVREQDSYTLSCGQGPTCNFPTPITIPRGEYYVLGDNRGESDDSRFWGPVRHNWIIGVVIMRTWPLSDLGFF